MLVLNEDRAGEGDIAELLDYANIFPSVSFIDYGGPIVYDNMDGCFYGVLFRSLTSRFSTRNSYSDDLGVLTSSLLQLLYLLSSSSLS